MRYVNANSLFFFSGQSSAAFQADVLTCSLYSHLAASKKYSAFDQVIDWRRQYFDVLTGFRCLIPHRENHTLSLEAGETPWRCLVRELGARVSPALRETAENTFIQLSSDTQSPALKLLEAQSIRTLSDEPGTYDVSLQIGFCDDAPAVTLGFLSFKTTSPVAGLPLAALLTEGHISEALELSIISFEVDEHDFGYFRQALIERLGSRRDELIVKIPEVQV
ncbi:hypothetical protein [Pseudomonas sp. DWP3-1-2]|uniref:hypothetical protein n=1 Tax=Pseudomonas sp. DWP3-1-2 TaxID=2804645 RepID=UPI003CE9709D